MKNQSSNVNNQKKLVLFINHKLRSLGIKTSHKGYKLIIMAIQLKLKEEYEFLKLELIYELIGKTINKTAKQVEDCIYYAITHRNYQISEKGFEKVFGYSYDETVFSNKEFFEEFINLLQLNVF